MEGQPLVHRARAQVVLLTNTPPDIHICMALRIFHLPFELLCHR